jgi:hypothetical protein
MRKPSRSGERKISMKFKKREDGNEEIIIDSEEREQFNALNKALKYDFDEKCLLIKEVFDSVLYISNTKDIKSMFSKFGGLLIYLDDEAMKGLISLILQNPLKINIILNKLEKDGIFAHNMCNFVKILTAKYGPYIRCIYEISEIPKNLNHLQTKVILDKGITRLLLNIQRNDGESLEFDLSFDKSIGLAKHLIRKTLEAIKRTDKEEILTLDKDQIRELEESISELIELRNSIESKVESAEKKI